MQSPTQQSVQHTDAALNRSLPQLQLAANMAGLWWTQRLNPIYTIGQRELFALSVAKLTLQELLAECYYDRWGQKQSYPPGFANMNSPRSYAEMDNSPCNCLEPALLETFPELATDYAALQQALPRKHDLTVFATRLYPKEGYGNRVKMICVPLLPNNPNNPDSNPKNYPKNYPKSYQEQA